MKKERILFYLVNIALISATFVSAQINPDIISAPIKTIACTFGKALIYISTSLAVLVFALAGVKWIYAQDDASKRKAARDTMIHCVIGLIIIGVANQLVADLKFGNCGDWSAW